MTKINWLELRNKYLLFDEIRPKKLLTDEAIEKLIASDNDYRIFMKGKYGEIYKYSNDGSKIGVYLKSGKSAAKRAKLLKKGARYSQVGETEFALILDADTLHFTAKIVGISRSRRKTGLNDIKN